jgi:plasmid maintenance system killer protein
MYALFAQNPGHPSLHFKKLGGYENVWSVRINEQYRAVDERQGDTIIWVWIGTHNEFDSSFG